MSIGRNKKFDYRPELFEEQTRHECQLLSVYKAKNEAGARLAAEKMIADGVREKLIKVAMEEKMEI